jgi:hypothetical protein
MINRYLHCTVLENKLEIGIGMFSSKTKMIYFRVFTHSSIFLKKSFDRQKDLITLHFLGSFRRYNIQYVNGSNFYSNNFMKDKFQMSQLV